MVGVTDGLEPTTRHPELVKRFGDELAISEELVAFSKSGLIPWSGRPFESAADGIVLAEGARALKTYRAVIHLCTLGYGEQASMLNRSLFEGMAVAHWAHSEPEDAVERFEAHFEHNRILWADLLRELGWDTGEVAPEELPDASQERRDELIGMFGQHGQKLWTGHRHLAELLHAIEDQWEGHGRDQLWEFFQVAHKDNNLMLHSGAWSLERAAHGLSTESDGEVELNFRTGPTSDRVGPALYGGFWTYVQTFSLVMDRFQVPNREGLKALHARGEIAFKKLSDEQTKDVGRNDPCPCGSGRKFKRCHGARATREPQRL